MLRLAFDEMATSLFPAQIATVALGIMGGMGAMLAITGIFGMAACSMSTRLRELGIRVALGAQGKEVLSAALGRALKLLASDQLSGWCWVCSRAACWRLSCMRQRRAIL